MDFKMDKDFFNENKFTISSPLIFPILKPKQRVWQGSLARCILC
jgi:hypothetical protein